MNSTVINVDFPVLIPALAKVAGAGVVDVFDALGGVNLTQPGVWRGPVRRAHAR
jgi:hypothetical protein